MSVPYRDRFDAGRKLAAELARFRNHPAAVVLGLPRGGVPVAFEVAQSLALPLDVFLVRKLGVPGHEELAMGAIASGGIRVLNQDVLRTMRIPPEVVDAVARREAQELERRDREYRDNRPAPRVNGQVCILVDDGLATGSSMRAAVAALRQQEPERIVVAVPVAPVEVVREFLRLADDVVAVDTPEPFYAVGAWYRDFTQTTDEEIRELLARAARDLQPR
ncbi:MAG TPA: phosphoribosyltransferase [Bryobacteraceae bacterium]|nr:phosphoribosyltransferase [Bryobacteraceae bacterium]